jgi:uncharacterized RDD family membrane protein YckC
MATVLEQVENAINRGDAEQARELLRDELLSNPTAEAYYLASLVAFDEEQQREFLEKALAIYPFHKKAYTLLKRINARHPKTPDRSEAGSRAQQESTAEAVPVVAQLQAPAELTEKRVDAPEFHLERLLTPPAPSVVQFPYAPFLKRFTANLIDSVILTIVARAVMGTLEVFGLLPPPTIPYIDVSRLSIYAVPNPPYLLISFVLGTLISTIYYLYFLCEHNGQTPGKALRKIRVVSLNGEKITRRQAFIRNEIGYWVSSFLLLGYLWSIWDPNHQTWHDKLAKTLVVKTS